MEKYIKPQANIEEFKTVDVITTSGTDTPSTGGPNETPFEPNI